MPPPSAGTAREEGAPRLLLASTNSHKALRATKGASRTSPNSQNGMYCSLPKHRKSPDCLSTEEDTVESPTVKELYKIRHQNQRSHTCLWNTTGKNHQARSVAQCLISTRLHIHPYHARTSPEYKLTSGLSTVHPGWGKAVQGPAPP